MSKKNKADLQGFVYSTDPNFQLQTNLDENNCIQVIQKSLTTHVFYGVLASLEDSNFDAIPEYVIVMSVNEQDGMPSCPDYIHRLA